MERATREILDTLAKTISTPIEEARNLPAQAYLSEELFELERERIFRREWLCVGREEQVANPGDYLAFDLVGEPIVVVRDAGGSLHALSNVCRHRYMQLVEGTGKTDKFVCPYHGWTYQLDGSLAGAPHMNESRIFDRRSCRLPEFRVETWNGFLFVNLDPDAKPLALAQEAASERLATLRLGEMCIAASIDQVWDGNWKLGFENGTETYHVPVLHPGNLGAFLDFGSVEGGGGVGSWVFQGILMDALADHDPEMLDVIQRAGEIMTEEDSKRLRGYNMFPCLVMDSLPGNCGWICFLPIDATHTRVIGGVLTLPSDLEAGGEEFRRNQHGYIDPIVAEDSLATTNLQPGLRSRYAAPGPMSHVEGALLHFHRYLARKLT